jgi:creatinine amidohydrolase
MYLHPKLVKSDQMRPDFAPTQGREFFDYTGLAGVSPTGIWGAPSKASAAEGEKLLQEAASQAVDQIRQTFAEIERLEAEREARNR